MTGVQTCALPISPPFRQHFVGRHQSRRTIPRNGFSRQYSQSLEFAKWRIAADDLRTFNSGIVSCFQPRQQNAADPIARGDCQTLEFAKWRTAEAFGRGTSARIGGCELRLANFGGSALPEARSSFSTSKAANCCKFCQAIKGMTLV